MNKYQEAFGDIVDNGVSLDYFNDKSVLPQDENPLFIVQELVDKETPMKPKMNDYKITRLDKFIGIEQTYTCPRCRNACLEMLAVNKRNIHRYCYDCGQKLDWGEDDE